MNRAVFGLGLVVASSLAACGGDPSRSLPGAARDRDRTALAGAVGLIGQPAVASAGATRPCLPARASAVRSFHVP